MAGVLSSPDLCLLNWHGARPRSSRLQMSEGYTGTESSGYHPGLLNSRRNDNDNACINYGSLWQKV